MMNPLLSKSVFPDLYEAEITVFDRGIDGLAGPKGKSEVFGTFLGAANASFMTL